MKVSLKLLMFRKEVVKLKVTFKTFNKKKKKLINQGIDYLPISVENDITKILAIRPSKNIRSYRAESGVYYA